MGKKGYLTLAIIFTVIAFIGILSVLSHTRNVNAGAAVIPAVFAMAFIIQYQKSKKI